MITPALLPNQLRRYMASVDHSTLMDFMFHIFLWLHKSTKSGPGITVASIFQQANPAWYQHVSGGLGTHIYSRGI